MKICNLNNDQNTPLEMHELGRMEEAKIDYFKDENQNSTSRKILNLKDTEPTS